MNEWMNEWNKKIKRKWGFAWASDDTVLWTEKFEVLHIFCLFISVSIDGIIMASIDTDGSRNIHRRTLFLNSNSTSPVAFKALLPGCFNFLYLVFCILQRWSFPACWNPSDWKNLWTSPNVSDWSSVLDKQYWHHLEAYLKCGISGPTPDLLHHNFHCNKIPGDLFVHYSLRSTALFLVYFVTLTQVIG